MCPQIKSDLQVNPKQEAQTPLILRCHRLMEAFAKSDDERYFYIDRVEGFLLYVDLDKSQAELDALYEEINLHGDRYCLIPKLSFYETKKIMESFVNEKVYDIDTKEKLLDIIQCKEARENFLEFIYDHHMEQEKWQQFYQERSRIRIIEWLRSHHFYFVFEEDLELTRSIIEGLKQSLFQVKASKEIQNARKTLVAKAKTYYSSEALNPRPKRGRPPKQTAKPDLEPQTSIDIYTTVSIAVRPFLFTPELTASSASSLFSAKFDSDEGLFASRRQNIADSTASLNQKLSVLRSIASRWVDKSANDSENSPYAMDDVFNDDDDDDTESDFIDEVAYEPAPKAKSSTTASAKKAPKKGAVAKAKPKAKITESAKPEKVKVKRIIPTAKKGTVAIKKKTSKK